MTSVGILTRHCYPNYGSLLQAFALESAFSSLGAKTKVIDYVPPSDTPYQLTTSSLRESRMRGSPVKKMLYYAIQGPNLFRMASRFRKYQIASLNLSETVSDRDGISAVAGRFDAVVTGSDQIWNKIHDAIDPNYYLAGVEGAVKKYSYAASFGSVGPSEEDVDRVLKWLKSFQSISVREPSALTELTALGERRTRRDVDPVLLHNRHFWMSYAADEFPAHGPYILVYQLHNTPRFDERLRQLRVRHNLPVRRVTADGKQRLRYNATDYLVSPKQFVRLFRDASVVLTDSFHGTAFSLAFGRPVYSLLPAKHATRCKDLLCDVGLPHLAVSANEDLPRDPAYDAEEAYVSLANQAEVSWRYLRTIVEQ